MDILRQHEEFEIEVLEKMNSARLPDPLVFDGGSMLRLCHERNRYSVDLDFWFVKKIMPQEYFDKIRGLIVKVASILSFCCKGELSYLTLATDNQLSFEISSSVLKTEILKSSWDLSWKKIFATITSLIGSDISRKNLIDWLPSLNGKSHGFRFLIDILKSRWD